MNLRNLFGGLLASILLAALAASPASAAFGLRNVDLSFRAADGSLATQAGSHPAEMTTAIAVNTRVDPDLGQIPEGETRHLRVDFPAGFVGDRVATPFCSNADFVDRDSDGRSGCPDATAVGLVAVKLAAEAIPADSGDLYLHMPVFNLVPPPGAAAKLGFVALNVPLTVQIGLSDTAPYHLVATSTNIPQALLFYEANLTTWGNPASPIHDPLRGRCLSNLVTEMTEEPISRGLCPVAIPEKPFLTLPRSCTGALAARFTVTPWKAPGTPVSKTVFTHDDSTPPRPVAATGCASLGFSPRIDTRPTTASAESPMGLDVSLSMKDEGLPSVTGIAQSDLKKAVVTLPEGVTVNPSAAEGLSVCSPAQYAAESLAAASCPEASKLGTVQVRTPLLDEVLTGSLYQAQPDDPATAAPGQENPFDSLLALYIVIRNPQNGVLVKLAGKVEPDPRTGQLISTFDDVPQFPFSSFNLHFREGPRSPLVTPPACGTYTTRAMLTPWANPDNPVEATSTFRIGSGPNGGACPQGTRPFKPGFEAGSINNNAGSYSPFYMRLTRQDGEQDMTKFSSILPPGVTGKIAGVGKCPDAAIAAAAAKTGRQEQASPSCPLAAKIGRVLAGAGVGSQLTYVPGQMYLAGAYNGAPMSVAVITPAVAGPFDAGTVVIRVGLALNPTTAEVEVDGAASDPIPHILKGIPLKLRDLRVYVDRERFTLNPTSCDPSEVRATLFGSFLDVFSSHDDVPVGLDSRYQAANCSNLAFKPRLSLKFNGGTKRGAYPSLRAELRARPGDANIGRAVVTLPHSSFLAQEHIRTICTKVQFAARNCPKGSIYGRARAFTPLLDEPLEGPVYLRSSSNPLPDMVAALRGVVDIDLVGRIDSINASIRSSFESPPDAPVSKFVLKMQGGKKGLIINSRNLCAHKSRAVAEFTGHNGKRHRFKPLAKVTCGKKKAKAKQRRSAGS